MLKKITAYSALALSLTAVSSTSAMAEKINVFSGVSPVFANLFMADKNGYFADEGLDVTVKTFQAGQAAGEAYRSGAAQYLVTCDQPMIITASGGDSVILTHISKSNELVFIMAGDEVSKAADLKGKKVGLFRKSASEFLLSRYLETDGLTLDDVEMVHLSPFDQVSAIVRGDVDAMSVWRPFDLKVMGLSEDHSVVTDSRQLGYAMYCGLLVNRAYLESADPEEVQKFLRALKRASDWLMETDPAESNQAISDYTKLAVADVEHVLKGQEWAMVNDQAFRDQLGRIEEFLIGLDLLDGPVDWDEIADWSHLKAVDTSLYQ